MPTPLFVTKRSPSKFLIFKIKIKERKVMKISADLMIMNIKEEKYVLIDTKLHSAI
jgi:hypothetical protein